MNIDELLFKLLYNKVVEQERPMEFYEIITDKEFTSKYKLRKNL